MDGLGGLLPMPHPLGQAAHTLSLPTTHLASLAPALYSSAVIATTTKNIFHFHSHPDPAYRLLYHPSPYQRTEVPVGRRQTHQLQRK